MSTLKDNLLIKKEGLKLSLEQNSFSFLTFIKDLPRGKRIFLFTLAIALLPTVIGVRISVQYLTQWQLRSFVISSHPSYTLPNEPSFGEVNLIKTGPTWYSAYVEVQNENLDLAAQSIPYTFEFYNFAKEKVATSSGIFYLLPNQKKFLVVPRVDTSEQLARAEVVLGKYSWQKRRSVPEVSLKAASPIVYNEFDPTNLVVEGAVVNNSAYRLGGVQLVFVLYDNSNRIIGISSREEYDVPAFGRRAYKQTWPTLLKENVARAVVYPDTNTLDIDNLIPETGESGDSLQIPQGQRQ